MFVEGGYRPALSVSEDHIAIAWYEGSRLRLGKLTTEGVTGGSVLAHVSGVQPYPELIPGTRTNQWLVGWLDYEAARPEPFILRADCQ